MEAEKYDKQTLAIFLVAALGTVGAFWCRYLPTRCMVSARDLVLIVVCLGVEDAQGVRVAVKDIVKRSVKQPNYSHYLAPGSGPTEWQDRLDKLRIEQIKKWAAVDGHVMWTLANYSWKDFVLNWISAVNAAGIENFFVATLDARLFLELKRKAVPCICLNSNLGPGDLAWGSAAFKARGIVKIRLIEQMLSAELHPVFSDLDVVWLRNPLPFVRRFPDANMLVSSDSLVPARDAMLDDCPSMLQAQKGVVGGKTYVGFMNVGIHLLRPSALPFAKAWREQMKKTGDMEQLCWNKVLALSLEPPGSSEAEPYCRAMKRSIRAGLLPSSLFQNGQTFFVQRTAQHMGLKPYAVHASFIAGKAAKIHHLREAQLWHVDPLERYNNKRRLLAVEMDLPGELLRDAGPPENLTHNLRKDDIAGHLRLMQHQAAQIKEAAAVARLLGRQLVMPQLWCGLENLWFPNRGRMSHNSEYSLPMACPMSQLFEPGRWQQVALEGHLPEFMESSYLKNGRVELIAGDMLNIKPCQESASKGGQCCGSEEECRDQDGSLHFSARMGGNAQLHTLLSLENVRVLKLWAPHRLQLTATLHDPGFHQSFSFVMRPWCCLDGGGAVNMTLPAVPPAAGMPETPLA